MKKVFLTRSDIPSIAVEQLKAKFEVVPCDSFSTASKDQLYSSIEGVHAIFCTTYDNIDKDILDAAGPQLQVISTASMRFAHIDIEECKKRNIIVTNVPDVDIDHIVEYVMGLILAVGRNIVKSSVLMKKWDYVPNWNLLLFVGTRLKSVVFGFVGINTISVEIIKRLTSFNAKEMYYYNGPFQSPEAEQLGVIYAPFEVLLQKSQYVIANCELRDDTKDMFNAKAFDIMQQHSTFINIGSEEVIQYDALLQALEKKKFLSVGLEISDSKFLPTNQQLLSNADIVITFRMADGDNIITEEKAIVSARNIISFLEEGKPLTPVY